MAAYVDPTTKLRIKNPIIESSLLTMHLKSRNVKPLARLSFKDASNDSPLEIDTCGVLIYKSPEKKTVSGDSFVVFRISDLETMQTTLTVMLFRDAVNEHIGIPIGSVVLLISAVSKGNQNSGRGGTVNSNGDQSESVSVNEPWQIVLLGTALDYSTCRGKKKNGQSCTIPVNNQKGGYCQFHIQKSVSAKPPGAKKGSTASSSYPSSNRMNQSSGNIANKMPPGLTGVYRKGSLGATVSAAMASTPSARFQGGGTTLSSFKQKGATLNPSSYYVPQSSSHSSSMKQSPMGSTLSQLAAAKKRGSLTSSSVMNPLAQNQTQRNGFSQSSTSRPSIYSSTRRPPYATDPSPGAKRPMSSSVNSAGGGKCPTSSSSSHVDAGQETGRGVAAPNSGKREGCIESQSSCLINEPTEDEWEQLLEKTEKQYELKEKQERDPLGCLLSSSYEDTVEETTRTIQKKKNIPSKQPSSQTTRASDRDQTLHSASGQKRTLSNELRNDDTKSGTYHSKSLKVDQYGMLKASKRPKDFYSIEYSDDSEVNRRDSSDIKRDGAVIVPQESMVFKAGEAAYLESKKYAASCKSKNNLHPQHSSNHKPTTALGKASLGNLDEENDESVDINFINGNNLPRLGVTQALIEKNKLEMKIAQQAAAQTLLESKEKGGSQPMSLNDKLKQKQRQAQEAELNKSVLGGCKLAAVMKPSLLAATMKKNSQDSAITGNPAVGHSSSQMFPSSSIDHLSNSGKNPLNRSSLSSKPINKSHPSAAAAASQGLSQQLLSLINVKSRHAEEVIKEDTEKGEAYLTYLAAKDAALQELEKITEQKCNTYHCDQCNRVTENICKLPNHSSRPVPAVRRFFECSNCKARKSVITPKGRTSRPPKPCSSCDHSLWVACGSSSRSTQKSSLDRTNGLLLSMSESTSFGDRYSSARDAVTGDF